VTAPALPWGAIQAELFGVSFAQHVILTYNGTWGQGLVQYPSDTVNGLNQYVNADLCYEINCPYPATFGFIGGAATSDSYQQSIQAAIEWTAQWLDDNPTQTFGLIGYSQGAEAASRIYLELIAGTPNEARFIGGITFGNPSRMAGSAAPGVGSLGPQWRGISNVIMTSLPTKQGHTIWADYAHNTINGDAANDMYPQVPNTAVGTIMTDVYLTATQLQINNFGAFMSNMTTDLLTIVENSGLLSGLKGGLASLIGMGAGAGISFLVDLIGGVNINATGANADVAAAVLGLDFVAAPGGSTAPHISYLGEIGGYSNLVEDAVWFLANLCLLTPAST
jgi:hypothetical protein